MANNPWFRVWGDMANDPKWRTIARTCEQKIGDVLAVYLHMMTLASNATERGRTQGFKDEDVATALDLRTDQVGAIRSAMQGRVLDGDYLTGWEKRQPLREDGSAERGKQHREMEKLKKELEEVKKELTQTLANATERNRTQSTAREEKRREEKKEEKVKPTVPPVGETAAVFAYWQQAMNHPQAKLDAKRDRAIKARLKDGYTVEQLCKAVDGCKLSPHHMGQNDTHTVYDDIELICRDGPKVDKFIGWVERGPIQQSRLGEHGQATANAALQWLEGQ